MHHAVSTAVAAVFTAVMLTISGAAGQTQLVIHADRPGAVINKNIYGQFSEHLGTGIYGGIYVGKTSKIPNTDGFRNDVIAALKDLHVPMVRWPGGCFADEYHWRDGIGPKALRKVTVNHMWGGVPEDNRFGTHEFFQLIDKIGADAYVNANVGTGSPRETEAWLEYMTSRQDTTLTRLRKANGRAKPWKVAVYAVGNETWGCGGNMRPQYYADLFKHYRTFIRAPKQDMPLVLASGGNDDRTDYTETLMREVKSGMDAISFHMYTVPTGKWGHKGASLGFPKWQWISTISDTLKMDRRIAKNVAIMDKYDPKKHVGFYVDEWGTWYDPDPGTNPGFLQQQNSIRDAVVAAANFNIFHKYADRVRMTAIAQTVNVLQAMLLTKGDKMVKTPTYYAYQMYIPFQDATSLPMDLKTDAYTSDGYSVPGISATAAKTKDGKIAIGLVNFHPDTAVDISVTLSGVSAHNVHGKVLTADKLDAHNDFRHPNVVHPVRFTGAKLDAGQLTATLPAKSIVVLEVD